MAHPKGSPLNLPEGFDGEVSGLGLADLIQIGVQNRFAGCIRVQAEQGTGAIFLKDGQVVHVEQGRRVGDEAFLEILRWPAGRFSLQPNVSSTRATIRKAWQHLLLEAHQILDEERAGKRSLPEARAEPEPIPEEPPARPATVSPIPPTFAPLHLIREIPGVRLAVLQDADGSPQGAGGYDAELLAGRALYLAGLGKRLGAVLGASELQSATVEGQADHLLLIRAGSHLLAVQIQADAPVREVESEVRGILARRR
jgi:predicted regulator of Ras-like GTPase activity (Roadblock/LC7/MglB family)